MQMAHFSGMRVHFCRNKKIYAITWTYTRRAYIDRQVKHSKKKNKYPARENACNEFIH